MKLIDCYYFAFKQYRKTTESNKDCQRDRQIYTKSNKDLDKFVVKKFLCNINSDWIETIESYLEFVQNAVAAERQFIRTDGEVVPIEKVRRVSRDSVVHLAKHSDLITHVDEEKKNDIIPDKLYMTERLSDYAVYENRVLYKLLCYLRDFIDLRLSNIEKLRKTYIADLYGKKEYRSKGRNVDLEIIFRDENYNNEYPLKDATQDNLISRIKDIESIVNMLLNTNLMMEVSKAPMVRDPIVKTNVLKMNNDFKNCVALYDYLVGYTDLGYTPEEVVKEFHPYSDVVSDDLAEVATLLSHLTNKFGNNIEDLLEENYQQELKKLENEEKEKLALKVKRLKRKILDSGMSQEEYMVLLEERNDSLEQDSIELKKCQKVIADLNNQIVDLNKTVDEQNSNILRLNDIIKQKEEEIIELNIKHQQEIEALNEAHKAQINSINAEHTEEINNLNQAHEEEVNNLTTTYETKINEINQTHEEEINSLNEAHEQDKIKAREDIYKEFEDDINDLNKQIEDLNINADIKAEEYKSNIEQIELDCNQKISNMKEVQNGLNNDLKAALEHSKQIQDELNFKSAELDCERAKSGSLTAGKELTQEEKFKELERNYKLYTKFYKQQWSLTKQAIRKEILWKREEKRIKKKDKSNNSSTNLNTLEGSNTDTTNVSNNEVELKNTDLESKNESLNNVDTLSNNQEVENTTDNKE